MCGSGWGEARADTAIWHEGGQLQYPAEGREPGQQHVARKSVQRGRNKLEHHTPVPQAGSLKRGRKEHLKKVMAIRLPGMQRREAEAPPRRL